MNETTPNMIPGGVPPVPPPDVPRGAMARLRRYFLTGLIIAGPIAITIYLIWWFVTWVDGIVRPFVPIAYRPETYLPFGLPGYGLIVAFFALTMLGFFAANLIGRTLVDFGENLLGRMPVVRAIYRGLKQVFETLFSGNGSSFRKVGLVEFPSPDLPAAEHGDRNEASAERRVHLGVSAMCAEPDDRILLLCSEVEAYRSRYEHRRRRDIDHVGGCGAAGQRRAEEGQCAGRDGQCRARRDRVANACEGGLGMSNGLA